MRVLSSDASKILVGTLLLDTASNGEAFSNLKHNGAKSTTSRSFVPKQLGFHPARFEEYEYRTPAESFTFTRYAKTEVTSEYVQSKWNEVENLQRLSYLDIISAAAPGSKGFDEKEDEPEEPLAQAHRIQQAYREWCEVRKTSSVYLPRVEMQRIPYS